MRRERHIIQLFLVVVTLFLVVPIVVSFSAISRIQSYARVINYTGMVRGGIQRLVKSELAGIPRDDSIRMLNGILRELTGETPPAEQTEHSILPLVGSVEYREALARTTLGWEDIQVQIMAVRGGADPARLFAMSEEIFTVCDDAVLAAEHFVGRQINLLRQKLLFTIALMLCACAGLVLAYRYNARLWVRSDEERGAERRARLNNEERYRIIMERTQDILFEWDIRKHRAYCSPNFIKKFGYSLPSNSFFTQEDSIRVCKADADAFDCLLGCLASGRKDYAEEECRLLDCAGNELWCAIKATVMRGTDGEPERLIGILSNIDVQKRERLALEEKATCDQPTGVFNKFTLEKKVEEYLAGEGRDGAHVLFIIDLDHFKHINDGYGHACGDFAIRETAARLKVLFRETDIVGRVGGDEFVVLLKNVASAEAICSRAERVLEHIREPMAGVDGTGELHCSASLGVALYPTDGRLFSELYRNADRALYASKEKGRDAFYLYDGAWMVHGTHEYMKKVP